MNEHTFHDLVYSFVPSSRVRVPSPVWTVERSAIVFIRDSRSRVFAERRVTRIGNAWNAGMYGLRAGVVLTC